jgi:hypothetical protein
MTASETTPALSMQRFSLVLGTMAALYLVLAYLLPPGADTLWRLHLASGMLEGKVLYHDLIEVNPPLWFWGAIPAAFFGGYPALVIINLAASACALWLFSAVLSVTLPRDSVRAGVLGLAAGLLLVTVAEIGQREQAFLVACALWCALIIARIDGKKIALPIVILATLFAAYGFALKHYFVLVPVALEAILIWKTRRAWRPIRAETLVLVACAALYASAVLILAPNYLGPVLELVQATYFGFGYNSNNAVERQIRMIAPFSILILPALGWLATRDKRPIILVLMVTIFMCCVIIFLQQKAWRYHLIAANGLALVVLALLWQGVWRQKTSLIIAGFAPVALLVMLFEAFVYPGMNTLKSGGEPTAPILTQIEAAEPKDHHIAVLSSAPDRAFYAMARRGRAHWTRHYSMWMMPGAITPQSDPIKEAKRLVIRDRVIAEFASDLTCNPPDLMIGEVGYASTPKPVLFDSVALLRRNAGFSAWLDANYVRKADMGGFPIWRLKGPKPAPMNCLKPPSR